MKKLLALVLALVMTLSLCTVSNAAYSDAADVDYKEAVDVTTAVGVFQGADGKFSPKAELTREQAAKLIAYLDLGEKTAEALPAVKVFNDVEANRWSAKYVAYCADAGYLAGVGDNNFDPAGKLTGYAFGKMLLCVLGYDAAIEGFTGANWSIKVAALMQDNDIADGVSGAASATLTREVAAQYCLNALMAQMVKYDDKGTGITVAGVEIKTGASDAKPYTGKNANKITAETDGNLLQLGEKLYDGKLTLAGNDTSDAFGRKANQWKYDTKKVGTYVTETPVLTYTTAVSPRTIYNDLGLSETKAASKVTWYIDGYTNAEGTKLELAKADNNKFVGGEGVLTEVYKYDDGTVKVVQVANYLAKITAVTEYKAATDKKDEVKASVTLTVYNTDWGTKTGKVFETSAFTKADKDSYVVVTLKNAHDGDKFDVKSAVAAETFDGCVDKYTTSGENLASVYVDGKQVKVANKYSVNSTDAVNETINNSKIGEDYTYTFYTDANGAILGIKTKSATVSKDYAYVLKVSAQDENGDLLNGSDRAAKAKVVFTDGTEKTVDLKITKSGGKYYYDLPVSHGTVTKTEITEHYSASSTPNDWFAYVENDDGTYSLKVVDDDYADVTTLTSDGLAAKESTTVGSKYTNKATVVTAIDKDGKVTSFTGYPSSKKLESANVLYTYAKDSSVVANIYAYDKAVTSADVTYAYAVEGGASTADGTEWIFAVDGAQVTYVIEKNTSMPTAKHVYTIKESTNTKGTYTVADDVDCTTGVKVTVVDESFIVAGTQYKVDEKTAVYNVNADLETEEVGFADEVAKDDYVVVITGTGDDATLAKVIYIITEG